MLLPDVNVLVYAHREDTRGHLRFRGWLERLVNGPEAFGLSDLILSGFLRIVTHPRVSRQSSDQRLRPWNPFVLTNDPRPVSAWSRQFDRHE